MAQKRNRPDVADGSEDDTDPSQTQSQSQKRTRTSQSQTNGHHSPTQDGSDMEAIEGGYTYQYHSNIPQDDTLHLDVSSGEDGEANPQDELRATQIVQKHYSEIKENMPSEQGIIEEVYMENFMCHAKLRISLGPLINFIVGHNGSGKSAILTALTICLGAKASSTNRSTNLKNFIRTGQESAYVSVKVKNQGDMSYQPENYGKSIIVERHFTNQGGSGFKIKNENGKIMSTKKAELENIVDYFALQLDNPMNVLSQDKAREFLSGSTAETKYKFFIRGTQLEQLDSDYRMLEERLDEIEARCDVGEQDVAVLGEKAKEAENKKKMMDRSQTLAEKINKLRWQHAWAQVEEQERELEKMDDEIRKAHQKIATQQASADRASQLYEDSNGNREANQRIIQELEESLVPLQENHDQIKSVFDTNKAELLNKKSEQRIIKEDMTRASNTMVNLQTKVDAERTRLENANGPAHGQKIAELENTRGALQDCVERVEQHGSSRMQLINAMNSAEEDVRNARTALAPKKQAINNASGMLQRLKEDQGQQDRAFSPQIHNVVKAINNTRGWTVKPVGPMGKYVRLLKPEWGSIIETTCGANLDGFVVRTKQDQVLLSRIMKQQNCPAPVLINNGNHIDTSHHEPEAGLDTMLRVLEFEDDAVRNCLIINQGIDQTVLIANQAEANQFAQSGPRNVRATMCHNPNQRGWGFRYQTTRSGGINMSPVRPLNKMFRIKTSAEEQIRLAQDNVDNAKRELQHVETNVRALENIQNRTKQAVTKHERDTRQMRTEKQRLEDRIEVLQAELDRDTANDTSALDELHSQLTEAQEALKASEASMQDSIAATDNLNQQQRIVMADVNSALQAVNEATHQLQKLQRSLDNKNTEREFALRKKNEALEMVTLAEQQKEQAVEARERQATLVGNYEEHATKICRRIVVEPGNTPDTLDKKLEAMIKERNDFDRRMGGDREQIYEAWRTAHRNFSSAQNALNGNKDSANKLKQALLYRKGRWKLFRKYITTRAKITFGYLLSERNFRGRILVNHREKALDISVEPDISKSSDKGRQTRTLSGGEKSFSTICLLLSIWEAMGSPIRCLDEFDVFMDSANREVSMKMMIQAARRSVGRQFVLITPQSMNKFEGSTDVNVHKMADPERGQTTLDFEPVARDA